MQPRIEEESYPDHPRLPGNQEGEELYERHQESPLESVRVLIADDEEPARDRLKRLLAAFPDLTVVGEAATGMEAIMLAKELSPHVVFLDIRMPPPTGLEAAKKILDQRDPPPLIVFVTAYDEHAVEAFELEASDYLVKPVQVERLVKTIERIRDSVGQEERWQKLLVEMIKRFSPRHGALDRIAVTNKEKGTRKVVGIEKVLWFTAKDEKCYARLADGQFEVSHSLTQLTASLPESLFVRTHRAYLVNLQQIKEIVPWFHGAYNLIMKNGEEVPLSRNYAGEFRQKVTWL